MKKITIRGGAVTLVDDDDFEKLSKMNWRNEKGYAKSGGAYNSVYMHRIIMNPPEDMQIDHINGKTLDNRKCNLRIVTEDRINIIDASMVEREKINQDIKVFGNQKTVINIRQRYDLIIKNTTLECSMYLKMLQRLIMKKLLNYLVNMLNLMK